MGYSLWCARSILFVRLEHGWTLGFHSIPAYLDRVSFVKNVATEMSNKIDQHEKKKKEKKVSRKI